jgi:succinoglycan biosynthesis transport protein ExoP
MQQDRTHHEGELRSLLRKVSRHKSVVVGCLLLGTGTAWFILNQAVPRYEAEAQVVLGIRSARIVKFESVLDDVSSQPGLLRTEMDIIVSRAMAERVVSNMSAEDRERLAATTAIVSPLQRLSATVATALRELERVAFAGKQELVKNEPAPEPADIHPPSSIPQVANLVDIVSRNVSATNDGQSYTIHIGYSSADPELAATVANLYAQSYIANQLGSKAEAAERASAWLSERLVELRRNLEASATAVQEYRHHAGILEDEQGTVTAQQLSAINSKLVEARAERVAAESRLATLQSLMAKGGDIEALSEVMSSPMIQSLRTRLVELEGKKAENSSRYTSLYPADQTLESDLAAVQRQIKAEVGRVVSGLAGEAAAARAKERALGNELARLQDRFGEASDAEVKLQILQRESDANRTVYEAYLSRLKETTEQGKLQEPDSYLISSAMPPDRPSYPKRLPLLFLGTIFGGVAGVVLALLRELFEQRLHSIEEVEQMTGLRVLALVPSIRWPRLFKPESYVLKRPSSLFNEALRTARAAITLSQGGGGGKVILVTSSIPGEGKTTFCLSLARLLATEHQKVLLIDSDLRRPAVSRALGATSKHDLAEFLAGSAALQDVVQIDQKSGASYISAHEGNLNAQNLLSSDYMLMLIEEGRSQYDAVIIDAPPILVAADAAIVARWADHCLFFIRWGSTAREYVTHALRKLDLYKVAVTGIVMSHVDVRRHAHYALGEGYYSAHGPAKGLVRQLLIPPRTTLARHAPPAPGE